MSLACSADNCRSEYIVQQLAPDLHNCQNDADHIKEENRQPNHGSSLRYSFKKAIDLKSDDVRRFKQFEQDTKNQPSGRAFV